MELFCLSKSCKCEAQYVCICSSSETFWCELHLKKHLKTSNRNHAFNTISSEPIKLTRDGILKFLKEEKLKKEALKKIALYIFTQNIYNPKGSMKKRLDELTSDLNEINDLIKKISQDKEIASLLNSLTLQPNFQAERVEDLFQNNSNSNLTLFSALGQLINKREEILNKVNNDLKTEQDFRSISKFYKNNASNWLLRHAYKEYANAYQKVTSFYNIIRFPYNYRFPNRKMGLFIYDTESEKEHVKILKSLNKRNCFDFIIIQLPNGELFGYPISKKSNYGSNFAFIIDRNDRFKYLNLKANEIFLTAIYFNRSVYCFGCSKSSNHKPLFNRRLDLDANRWFELAAMNEYNYICKSILFNGNILIAEENNPNLSIYSIDIDSFSEIPYKFAQKNQKIIINAEDRLFLIESEGWIYESEVQDEYNWKKISASEMKFYGEIDCSYNKGAIYISSRRGENFRHYFKFDLDKKELIDIACYGEDIAIAKVDGKLKTIECYDKNIKLSSDYIRKGYTLGDIAENLKEIEYMNVGIQMNPNDWRCHGRKGDHFNNLGWNLEAIEYYNKAIEIAPSCESYYKKGNNLSFC